MLKKCSFFSENRHKVLFFHWRIAMIHVQIWTQAEKWISTLPFHMGPRKAKQEVKFKNPTFYSIVYTGYKLHQLVAPPPENVACQGPSTSSTRKRVNKVENTGKTLLQAHCNQTSVGRVGSRSCAHLNRMGLCSCSDTHFSIGAL